MRGVGKYKDAALRIFKNSIKKKYPGYVYDVIFCYDTDLFEYAKKPPVNWQSITAEFEKNGANVHHVRAKRSIEDWFLLDPDGLCTYLRLPKNQIIKGYRGVKGLESLFRKANKVYIKGKASRGLVQSLNMDIIFPQICKEVHVICEASGLDCSFEKLCQGINERKRIKG